MVGHEKDDRVFEVTLFFETIDQRANVRVSDADGVQICGPIFSENRKVRIVGW